MTLRTIGTGQARWPSTVSDEPLVPRSDAVGLLTNLDEAQCELYGWCRETTTLYPLPDLERHVPGRADDVLAPGGRVLLFERSVWIDRPTTAERVRSLGIYKLTLASGQIARLNYEPRGGDGPSREFGCAPDAQHAAVSENWSTAPPGQPAVWQTARVTVSLAGFTGPPAREVLMLAGSSVGRYPLQWSPDGKWLAFGASAVDPTGWHRRLYLFDGASGQLRTQVDGVCPYGSAAWTPDSTRLLVGADYGASLFIYDVPTDTLESVPALPGQLPNDAAPGAAQILGFADAERLLVSRQRRLTMTISTLDIASGATDTLINWTGSLFMYPKTTTMPEGYWT